MGSLVSSEEQSILDAARRGNVHEFRSLARSFPGGLNAAQALVRRAPVIRVSGAPVHVSGQPPRGNGKVHLQSRGSSDFPVLRSSGSGFTVHLPLSTQEKIEQEILDARAYMGDVETGGGLYSLYLPNYERVLLHHATGPGKDARHARGRVKISSSETIEAEFAEWDKRARFVEVGDWHSHPVAGAGPSRTDLDNWAACRERSGIWRYSSLIVEPGELGWMTPVFRAWVTTKDEHGRLVTEPATIDN